MHRTRLSQVLRAAAVALTLAVCACAYPDLPKAQTLEAQLNASLRVGDTREKIESVLSAQSPPVIYSYDQFQNRYQGIVRSKFGDWHAVVVYVRLDTQRTFTSVEVIDSYTGP